MLHTIYTCIGAVVFWCAVALCSYLLGSWALEKSNAAGYIANYWLWFKVFVLRRPIHMTYNKARFLTNYGKQYKRKLWLPRDIIARCIRYSKHIGWKPETE
jgi:hypothetical protein